MTIFGSGFIASAYLACRVDGNPVATTFISDKEVECFLPPSSPSLKVLEVSNNGQDFIEATGEIEYRTVSSITKISPSAGSMDGNTLVTVHGKGFLNSEYSNRSRVFCSFDNLEVPAQIRTDNELECLSPVSTKIGAVELTVVARSLRTKEKEALKGSIPYRYFQQPGLLQLSPIKGPSLFKPLALQALISHL